MAKRQFGSLRKLPSGRWQVRYRNPVGNRLVTAGGTFPTRADAGRWLAAVETDIVRGNHVDPAAGEVLLGDYAETWLAQRVLRPRTVELYRGLLKRYIVPALGGLELRKLSPLTVRAWHAELLGAGRPGPVTVAKAYRLLRTICATAVADELIVRNPCNVQGASVERSAERPVLTVAQLDQLVSVMEPRYRAMVLLAAWCGLRLGELMALTREDLDVANERVRVEKAGAELKSGERIIGPPKTAAGRRTVAIPPHILYTLAAHLSTYVGSGPDSLVFVGTKGQPVRRASLYTAWSRATKSLDLSGFHFHDLRHTGATLAATTGASTRELMVRLGHASPSAALRYQHATTERDSAIAKELSRLAALANGDPGA